MPRLEEHDKLQLASVATRRTAPCLPWLLRMLRQLDEFPRRRACLGVAGVLLLLALGIPGRSWSDEPIPIVPDPVTIRPGFERGDVLQYNMRLAGKTAWTPQVDEVDWGRLETDFTFRVRAKTERPGGAWTFDLHGENLRSTGETSKGKIDVTFTESRAKIKPRGRPGLRSKSSPFERPMTLTVGPRGDLRFGTGLVPLAVYLLPQVDARFWTALTMAPEEPLELGDKWEHELRLPVPGARGEPLHVEARWKVLGFERYKSRRVIAVGLVAEIEVDDVDLILKNGDEVHIASGRYRARGKALWDVETGLLCSATADQNLLLHADAPTQRALRSTGNCTLRLLAVQKAPAQ